MRQVIRVLSNSSCTFRKSEEGNFTMITGLLAPAVFLAAFMALDYSNKERVAAQIETSLDAAALAASTEAQTLAGDMDEDEATEYLKEYVHTYFNANFDHLMGPGTQEIPMDDFEFDYDRETNQMTVNVTYDFETAGLRAFNYETLEINKTTTTQLAMVPEYYVIDIVMCLDATGSMQSTLDAVKASANSFSDDLKSHLGGVSNNVKVRVKPIFYRDWEDHVLEHDIEYTDYMAWYVPYYHNYYKNAYGNQYEGGLIESDFIDLDPSTESGLSATAQREAFETFTGSERAAGGWNWPEAAGACLNEGIRSTWFDNQSDETRDYFDIDSGVTIIEDGEEAPETGDYVKVSTIPVIVFWTDASINSLTLSQRYISASQPTSYSAFENLWDNEDYINQDRRIMIRFGPQSSSGWNTIKNWENYYYGGSLSTGNSDGVEKIADIIKETVPDILSLIK